MKKSIAALLLFAGISVFGQFDLEDRDDSFILENNKNILKVEILKPFQQVKTKGCQNFTTASFEGGTDSYSDLLKNYMYQLLNADYYTLNGTFTFTLFLDEKGKVLNTEGAPKIDFINVFFDDMKYVVRRIKQNWKPATCDGKPVPSEMKIKMNFSSSVLDL